MYREETLTTGSHKEPLWAIASALFFDGAFPQKGGLARFPRLVAAKAKTRLP